jgi:acyl carrier protein
MRDQDERLIRCFASVFPALSQEEIENASSDSIGMWDSLSTVTLAAVIQEEFDVEIEPDALPDLDSFRAFHDYLNGRQIQR